MPKAYWVTTYRAIKDAGKVAAYAKLAGPALTTAEADEIDATVLDR